MPITATQKTQADQRQWNAAQDQAPKVRLVAGPGTGKSYAIEKRVADLLNNGATPTTLYVISFTRATCAELADRIRAFCSGRSDEKVWSQSVSSLAKEMGISDVGLAKICKRYNIPRPGLGYWVKKQAGDTHCQS
jgi:hypothetical protein